MFVPPPPPVGTVLYRVVDRPRRFPRRLYTPAANIILLPPSSSPFSFATLPLPVPWNISSHLFPSCHLPWKRCLFSILRVPSLAELLLQYSSSCTLVRSLVRAEKF